MDTGLVAVRKAIEFGSPDHLPCYHSDPEAPPTDMVGIPYVWRKIASTADTYTTEWGFVVRPNTLGPGYHVDYHPILDWKDYARYAFPDVKLAKQEITRAHEARLAKDPACTAGKYVMGHICAGPYLYVGMIRREDNFFMDLLSEKERVSELFGRVMDYQIALFRHFADLGAHGVLIHEDWGSSHGLIMSPASWREIFLPHYVRACQACHARGLHFCIQVTGNVAEIIPDLIAMKLDVLFYPEPRVIGIDRLARLVRGKMCAFASADWKATLPNGTPDDVRADVRELVERIAVPEGGLGFWLICMSSFYTEANRRAQIAEYRRLRQRG